MDDIDKVMSKETEQTECLVAFMTQKCRFRRILASTYSYEHAKLKQLMQRDGSQNNWEYISKPIFPIFYISKFKEYFLICVSLLF